MSFLPNRLFAPAPIKRKVDCGDTMKYTWATEKGSRRTGVEMKVDARSHMYSRIFSVIEDWRRRLRSKVAISRYRGEVQGQQYNTTLYAQLRVTMETAFRAYGCGNAASIRGPFGFFKRPPEPEVSDNRIKFSRDESAEPYSRRTHEQKKRQHIPRRP